MAWPGAFGGVLSHSSLGGRGGGGTGILDSDSPCMNIRILLIYTDFSSYSIYEVSSIVEFESF